MLLVLIASSAIGQECMMRTDATSCESGNNNGGMPANCACRWMPDAESDVTTTRIVPQMPSSVVSGVSTTDTTDTSATTASMTTTANHFTPSTGAPATTTATAAATTMLSSTIRPPPTAAPTPLPAPGTSAAPTPVPRPSPVPPTPVPPTPKPTPVPVPPTPRPTPPPGVLDGDGSCAAQLSMSNCALAACPTHTQGCDWSLGSCKCTSCPSGISGSFCSVYTACGFLMPCQDFGGYCGCLGPSPTGRKRATGTCVQICSSSPSSSSSVSAPTDGQQANWIVPVAVTCAILALLLVCFVATAVIWKRKQRAGSQGVEMVTARAEDTNSVRNDSDYGILPGARTMNHYADHTVAVTANVNSHYDQLTPIEVGVSPI
jgi:hypothetical protein